MINDPPTSCCKGDTEYLCDYGGTGVAANYASPKEQRLMHIKSGCPIMPMEIYSVNKQYGIEMLSTN